MGMEKDERQRKIKEAFHLRAFPGTLQLPENSSCRLLTSLFEAPVFVWVPESLNQSRKPLCIEKACQSVPSVKEYRSRRVADVSHDTQLLYVKYQCTGESKRYFSTVNSEYLQRLSPEVLLQFPYILSAKTGVSKPFMDMVHEGNMSPSGLAGVLANVEKRRTHRYYRLRSLFAFRATQFCNLPTPEPPCVESFCEKNPVPDQKSLTNQWLSRTELSSTLSETLMLSLEINSLVRIDHSQKFCKRLKNYGENGEKENAKEIRMLLLMQNEVGQIVARCLTRSENNEETANAFKHAVLPRIQNRVADGMDMVLVITDNANALRKVVGSALGGSAEVKQDPFHVIQRFTEKMKNRGKKKQLAKGLSSAIYAIDEVMEERLRASLGTVRERDLLCSQNEWKGCIESNMSQVRRGDMWVSANTVVEAGEPIKVVSTSQLESFHSSLKKLIGRSVSIEVGLRILDIFILQHNLRAGAKFGRNQPLGKVDFVELCTEACHCHGLIGESRQLEFALKTMPMERFSPQYRLNSSGDFNFSKWFGIFRTTAIDNDQLERQLEKQRRFMRGIRELLLQQATEVRGGRINRADLFSSLNLAPGDAEVSREISSHEFELIRQLRKEQRRSGRVWSQCSLVTTLLFNIVVTQNSNSRFDIRRRGYKTIAKKVSRIESSIQCDVEVDEQARSSYKSLFSFAPSPLRDEKNTAEEENLQLQLFRNLQEYQYTSRKFRLFVSLYDFASCVAADIFAKSEGTLKKRWDALRKQHTRNSALKFKLKVPIQRDDNSKLNGPKSAFEAQEVGQPYPTTALQHDESIQNWTTIPPVTPVEENVSDAGFGRAVDTFQAAFSTRLPAAAECEESDHQPDGYALQTEPSATLDSARACNASVSSLNESGAFISNADIAVFKDLSDSMGKHRAGKWNHLHSILKTQFPQSQMSANALRCRVKLLSMERPAKRPKLDQMPSSSVPAQASTILDTSSCVSCKTKKKRCGSTSTNRHCLKRQTGENAIMSAFLLSK